MKYYIVESRGYYPEGSFNNIIKITPSERRAKNIATDVIHKLMCELRGSEVIKRGDSSRMIINNNSITFIVTVRLITRDQVENLQPDKLQRF